MGGGGGGDGGYQERADAEAARKQQARNQLNVLFGVAPTGGGPAAPDRQAFYKQGGPVAEDGSMPGMFDEAGYNAAQAEYNSALGLGAEAERNKAAREALYGKVREDAFTAGKRQLDERRDEAARKTKFALFERGLNGSSQADDQNTLVNRTYQQGLLDLGARADGVRADLSGNDEQTRLGLLESLNAGTDQGSAISSALNQMKVASDKAAATAAGANLGDLFGDAGLLYNQNNVNNARIAARNSFNQQYPGLTGQGSGPLYSRTG